MAVSKRAARMALIGIAAAAVAAVALYLGSRGVEGPGEGPVARGEGPESPRSESPPEPAAERGAEDPFGMAGRCPWYDPDALSLQWTFYLVGDEGDLIYAGFAGRLVGEGGALSGVHVVLVERGREVVNAWRRLGPEAFRLESADLDASIGGSRVEKRIEGGRTRYIGHFEVEHRGRPVVLDLDLERTVEPCGEGGFALLSREDLGNHFEYEVPCPKGRLVSGSLSIGGEARPLSGEGYVESIRWLSSPMAVPLRWYWGYAYAGPYTALFFWSGYPGGKNLLLLSEGSGCVLADLGADIGISERVPVPDEVEVRYRGEGLDLALDIDARGAPEGGFGISLAPYRIEIDRGGERYSTSGAMVFEPGEWGRF